MRMFMGMFGAKKNFKVRYCIVELVAVFVVNNLSFANGPSKISLHDSPMFKDLISINRNHPVPVIDSPFSVGSSLAEKRITMISQPGVMHRAESFASDSLSAFLNAAKVGLSVLGKSSGCRVFDHSIHRNSSLACSLSRLQMDVKKNRSAKRVNSVEALVGCGPMGNTEPSLEYILGRCNDYRRGSVLLITGKNARRESDDIVYSPKKLGVERVVTATDGNAITACKSAANAPAGLFAGITDASMTDSAYGLIQVYGFRTSAYVSAASANTEVPGTFLQGTSVGLEPMTTSAATTSGWVFISLMETVATSSAVANRNVFIRSL